MSTASVQSERRRLVIAYGDRSFPVMELATATRGLCDAIWLLDPRGQVAELLPLIERLGVVVPALADPPEQIAAALRPLSPAGIVTFTDEHMERLAHVAELLEMPIFNSPQAARNLEDKLRQREALRAGGVWTPPVIALSSGDDRATLTATTAAASYPAVLKPRRATGSRHAFKVADRYELRSRLDELRSWPAEEFVLEGYLSDGPPLGGLVANYVSVESMTLDGVIRHLATNSRLPLAYPLRETAAMIPSLLAGVQLTAVLELATQALQAVGVRWGFSHTEIKLTAEGPAVIEVNGRIGGAVPRMLRLVAGVNLVRAAMEIALGLEPVMPTSPGRSVESGCPGLLPTQGVGYYLVLQPPATARRVRSITGVKQLRARPGVEDVSIEHVPGAVLDAADGSPNYVVTLAGVATDHDGVIDMYEQMQRDVKVEYEYDTPAG